MKQLTSKKKKNFLISHKKVSIKSVFQILKGSIYVLKVYFFYKFLSYRLQFYIAAEVQSVRQFINYFKL